MFRRETKVDPVLRKFVWGVEGYRLNPTEENFQVVVEALDEGANPEAKLENGQTQFTNIVKKGITKVVELLIERNVDPNENVHKKSGVVNLPEIGNKYYVSGPLHMAAANGQSEVAEVLFEHMTCEFDKNTGASPLHVAVAAQDVTMVRTLLAHKCDPYAVDYLPDIGKNAFEWAENYGGDKFKSFDFDAKE